MMLIIGSGRIAVEFSGAAARYRGCPAAAAAAAGQPRYRAAAPENSTAILPLPMINIISGGAHTGRSLDIQDLLVLPVGAERFAEAIEMAWRVRRGSAAALDARRVSRA